MSQRLDYNKIADRYDTEPHRAKAVDADLLTFIDEKPGRSGDAVAILDIGCGTGSQLLANRGQFPAARMAGLDLHAGMLRQASSKAPGIDWLQADGARLPFRDGSFDFTTSQFSFHHVQNKAAMLAEVYRVLRPGGRFVLTNFSPRETSFWTIYRYFPAAQEIDLQDFLPNAKIKSLLAEAGFARAALVLEYVEYEQTLQDLLAEVRLRVASQLNIITEVEYRTGLRQIEAELAQAHGQKVTLTSKLCLVKIRAEKQA